MKPRHGRRRKAHAAAAILLHDHRQPQQPDAGASVLQALRIRQARAASRQSGQDSRLQHTERRQLEQSAEHAAQRRQQIAKDYGRHRYDYRSNVPLN